MSKYQCFLRKFQYKESIFLRYDQLMKLFFYSKHLDCWTLCIKCCSTHIFWLLHHHYSISLTYFCREFLIYPRLCPFAVLLWIPLDFFSNDRRLIIWCTTVKKCPPSLTVVIGRKDKKPCFFFYSFVFKYFSVRLIVTLAFYWFRVCLFALKSINTFSLLRYFVSIVFYLVILLYILKRVIFVLNYTPNIVNIACERGDGLNWQ